MKKITFSHGALPFRNKQVTLATGILGHVLPINTEKISIYVFHTIKASSGEYRLVRIYTNLYSPDDA